MSESENDDEEGTNHLSVGHLSNQQISDLCLATRAVQEAFNGKSREELNRRINELNQKWMEVTNAPEHVIRTMQHRLSLPTTSSRSSRRRGNKRKAGNNSNGDDSRKRVANGEEEEAKEAEDDADTRREADKEGDAIDDDLQMVRATRTKLLALRSDGDYESDYAIGRLPSLCSMTSYNLDFIFEDESDDKVDEDIMVVIDGIILVHRIGMEKAQLFRKTASEGVWNSIDCRTMGSLANVLDESTSQETVDSTEYNNVRKAIFVNRFLQQSGSGNRRKRNQDSDDESADEDSDDVSEDVVEEEPEDEEETESIAVVDDFAPAATTPSPTVSPEDDTEDAGNQNLADPAAIIAENLIQVEEKKKTNKKDNKTNKKEKVTADIKFEQAPKNEPSDCSDMSEDERADAIRKQLSEITDLEVLDNDMTPQGKAYDWITYFDNARLCPGGSDKHLLSQRYALATLYFSTTGDDWFACFMSDPNCASTSISVSDFNPSIGGAMGSSSWLSGASAGSECSWHGIRCNDDKYVQKLEIGK